MERSLRLLYLCVLLATGLSVKAQPTTDVIAMDKHGDTIKPEQLLIPQVKQSIINYNSTCTAGYFQLYFSDVPGVGFMDAVDGANRRAVACQVFTDIAKLIVPKNANQPVYVLIGPTPWGGNPSGAALADASAIYLYYPLQCIGFLDGQTYKAIATGVDPYGGVPSYQQFLLNGTNQLITGYVSVNWAQSFYTGLNLSPGPTSTQHDLYSVILHESLHMLALTGMVVADGSGGMAPSAYTRFDSHLVGNDDGALLKETSCYCYTYNKYISTTGGCGNVFFRGKQTSYDIPLYTPTTWQQGSSMSHFDNTCGPDTNYIMYPSNSPGAASVKRTPTIPEAQTLCDLNFSISGTYGITTAGVAQNVRTGYTTSGNNRICGVDDRGYSVFAGSSLGSIDILGNDVGGACANGHPDSYICLELLNPGAGTIGPAAGNASTNITFTPDSFYRGFAVARYIPVCNGVRGTETFLFIEVTTADALNCGAVPSPDCNPNACNLICNGDFENFTRVSQLHCFLGNFKVNNVGDNSSDLVLNDTLKFVDNPNINLFSLNTQCSTGGCGSFINQNDNIPYPHDYPQKHKYVNLACNRSNTEGLCFPLNQPLVTGVTYRLSFWGYDLHHCGQSPTLNFIGSSTPPCPLSSNVGAFFFSPTVTNCNGLGTFRPINMSGPIAVVNQSWDYYTVNYTPSPADGAINYVSFIPNLCYGSALVDDISVTPLFTPVATADMDCSTGTAQLDVTVAGQGSIFHTYHWSPVTLVSDSTTRNPVATVASATTFTVTVSNGCTSLKSTVTVSPGGHTPSVSITSEPGTTIVCSQSKVKFTAAAINGGANPGYQWQVNGKNVGINYYTYTADSGWNTGDVIRCIVTSGSACATPATATSNSITLTVSPSITPVLTITPNTSTTICKGTLVTFTAAVTNGGSSPSYSWYVNGKAKGIFTSTYTDSLKNSDIVTCAFIPSSPCTSPVVSNADTMTVSATPYAPQITIAQSPPNPICAGTSVTFSSSIIYRGSQPVYSWRVNGVTKSNASTYTSSTLANNDVVTCIFTANDACASPATDTAIPIKIVIGPVVPTIIIDTFPNGPVCSGAPATFIATATGGGTTPVYEWSVNGSVITTGSSRSFTSSTLQNGDSVTCKLTSAFSCASPKSVTSKSIKVVIGGVAPTISIAANPVGASCPGKNIVFTATTTGEGANPIYQWKVNGVVVGSSNTYNSSSLKNNDTVICILTNNAACSVNKTATSNQVKMIVNPSPQVAATGDTSHICPNDSVKICATPGFATYTWNSLGQQTSCIYARTAGNYYLTATDNNGCSAESNHFKVQIYPPTTSSISSKGDTLRTDGGVSYQWYYNGKPIPNATSNIYVAKLPGTYYVQVTDANGCITTSSQVNITGLNELADTQIKLYPNPNNGNFMLEFSDNITREVTIADALGRTVTKLLVSKQKQISLDNASNGIYFIIVREGEQLRNLKFTLSR